MTKLREGSRPLHPMVREIIQEELEARGWSDPVTVISELAKCGRNNVERLLQYDHRFTGVECYIMEKAFGLSDGFFTRLQKGCEERYPQKEKL